MPNKVTLVKPNGELLDATPEQAAKLALLGYKQETPEQADARLTEEAQREFYSQPLERFTAGAEGLASGLSFGVTDYLIGSGVTGGSKEDLQARARYNPGTRMATEALGAIAPILLTGGTGAAGQVARAAPTAALTEGVAGSLGRLGLSEPSLARAVAQGVLEGGVFGGAASADRAYLDGSPITAEAVLHGVGWGALLGGAFSGVGHGLAARADSKVAGQIEDDALAAGERSGAIRRAENEVNLKNQSRLREYDKQVDVARAKAGQELGDSAKKLDEIEGIQIAAKQSFGAVRNELDGVAKRVAEMSRQADELMEATTGNLLAKSEHARLTASGVDVPSVVRDMKGAQKLYSKAMAASEAGNFKVAMKAADDYAEAVQSVGARLGEAGQNPGPALRQLIEARAASSELSRFPRTAEEFAAMSPQRAERLFAAVDVVAGNTALETGALNQAVKAFGGELGLDVAALRDTWTAVRDLMRAGREAKKAAERGFNPKMPAYPKMEDPAAAGLRAEGKLNRTAQARVEAAEDTGLVGRGLLRSVLGYALGGKAYVAAKAMGFGQVGSYAAYRGVRDMYTRSGPHLANTRNTVLGRIRAAAEQYLPGKGTGEAMQAMGPKLTPLTISLATGRQDTDTSDLRVLAKRRSEEIARLGPNIKDVVYRELEPLSGAQPQLAPALMKAAVQSFQALAAGVPRASNVVSGLQNIWRPSEVQALVLGKQLAVFHDPVGEAESMLQTGKFDPIKVRALQQHAPALWNELRLGVLNRIADPAVRDKMTYQDQIGLSAMLDISIHSSMEPGNIASSQQIFLQRNQPLNANPRMGQGGGMPNPQDNVNATQSQKQSVR